MIGSISRQAGKSLGERRGGSTSRHLGVRAGSCSVVETGLRDRSRRSAVGARQGTVEGYEPDTSLYYELEGNTLEEKANTLRRQEYAENKDEINEQKRIAYAKRTEGE